MLRSAAATLYLVTQRAFRTLHGGAQTLFEGFWMGILPESVYDVISEQSYGEGEAYTNDRYLDSGLHFWEELAIRKHFAPGSRILVGSAGGGQRISRSPRRIRTTGFECSRAMVEAGKRALAERRIAVTLDWAPPSVAPKTGSTYDGIIVGWNGYCYISPRARRIRFLKDLHAQMKPNAPILVSAAMRMPQGQLLQWTPRVANVVRRCTFRAAVFEPGDSFSTRPKMHFTRRQPVARRSRVYRCRHTFSLPVAMELWWRAKIRIKDILVDLKGFEPLTSSMPWKRAPNCATGPHGVYRTPNDTIITSRRSLQIKTRRILQ